MSLWSFITGTTPQEEQQANLAKQQALFEERLLKREIAGTITQEHEAELRAYSLGVQLEDTDAAARAGFAEGLQEGKDNVNSAIFGTIGNVLGAIPVSVWVVLAVGGFIYLGGLNLIKGAFKK